MLLGTRETIKASMTGDPSMSSTAKARIRTWVDILWADVMQSVEDSLQDTRERPLRSHAREYQDIAEEGAERAGQLRWWNVYSNARISVLYHFLPFDLSFLGNLQDPVYWVFFVLSMIPVVRVVFFAFILLFVYPGPPDEFQVVQYILMFKGLQWLSSGLVLAVCGMLQYYVCVQDEACRSDGPGVSMGITIPTVDMVGCCLLVWTAFLLLPFTTTAVGARANETESPAQFADLNVNSTSTLLGKEVSQKEHGVSVRFIGLRLRLCAGRGGRLKELLFYDVKCFLPSCGLLAVLVAWGTILHPRTWQPEAALYLARVFYSFSALPFTIFSIPGLQSILTHTKITGFNRHGRVVKYLLPPLGEEDLV